MVICSVSGKFLKARLICAEYVSSAIVTYSISSTGILGEQFFTSYLFYIILILVSKKQAYTLLFEIRRTVNTQVGL